MKLGQRYLLRPLYVAGLLAIIGAFIGCVPEIELSPMQRRQITTRMFDSSYDNAFRATMTVLQDQGYVIKNTDMQAGLILASVDRETSSGSQIAQYLLVGHAFDKGTEVEISCTVNNLNDFSTEVRINIQEVKYGQSSWLSGTSKQSSKQIYEPELYRSLFNEITVEIKRREAIAGTDVEPEPSTNNRARQNESGTRNINDIIPDLIGLDIKVGMADGNILRGRILSEDEASILIKTSMGELKVFREKIKSIESISKKVSVELSDGTVIIGKITSFGDDKVGVETALGILSIGVNEIVDIKVIEEH
jgi:hypothetical protein